LRDLITHDRLDLPLIPRRHGLLAIMGGSISDVLPNEGGDDGMDLDPIDGNSDDSGDDDDLGDDGSDRRQVGEEDDDWSPPTKAEWNKIKSAVRSERQKRRELKVEYESKIQNLTSSASGEALVAVEQAKIEAEQRTEKKWLKRTARAEAKAQFAANGASDANADRLSLLVDLDKVSYDERDQEFDGLVEEIEDIMAENPEFFRKPKNDEEEEPRSRRPAPPKYEGATRGRQGGPTPRKRSSADLLAARALGRQPRR
jgi:hypothetical protein